MNRFLLVAWLAAPAAAQVDVGAAVGPDALLHAERARKEEAPVLPIALAASLAFDATTWAAVEASSVPARDLTALVRRGYYKLELLTVVLLAQRAGVPLKEIVDARDKGKTLREIAGAHKLDFDALYEEANRLDGVVVERLLPSIMAVSVRSAAPEPPPAKKAAPRRREKP